MTSANRRPLVLYSTFVNLVAIERQRREYSDATLYYQTTHCVEAVKRHEEGDGTLHHPRHRIRSPSSSFPSPPPSYRSPSLQEWTFGYPTLWKSLPEPGMCKLRLLVSAIHSQTLSYGPARSHISLLWHRPFPIHHLPSPTCPPPSPSVTPPAATSLRVPPAHTHPRKTCVLVCTDPAARR